MNLNLSIFWIAGVFAVIGTARQESWDGNVVETFHWTPRTNATNLEWEFLVIGKRVTWSVAKLLCSSEESTGRLNDDSLDPEDVFDSISSTSTRTNLKIIPSSRLAVLEDNNAKIWLSRMLSESNYRYDGLWIGGHRTNTSSNWTWIGNETYQEIAIPSSPFFGNYPEWYRAKDRRDMEKNCLVFDRVGHDLPILVPTDCQLRKPFLCSRVVMKKIPKRIVEGISVVADGYRYTAFSVDGGQEDTENWENTSGVRKLNGGGVKWKDARLECRKRGQYLATVLSNEAATAIAAIMLKNRPSMESVWLGGWSTDGADWTWSPTGFELPSTKSLTSQYPPWLSGHPVSSSSFEDYYQRRGRCLILDRHLCPDHISPVFLDLDCEKKRPFICQEGLPQRSGLEYRGALVTRRIQSEKRILEFSADQMTWNEGREHCANNHGRIASILDSETLSAVLDKMTDLYLDHVWVGGRTEKRIDGWRWFDETGKALSRKGIGMRSSWCLGDDEGFWPKADPDTCLNLDREGHGLPLFYGLPCDFAKQHVLCSIDHGSRSLQDESASAEKKKVQSGKQEEGKFSSSGRRSFGPTPKIPRKPEKDDGWITTKSEIPADNSHDDANEEIADVNIYNSQPGNTDFSGKESMVEKLKVRNWTSDPEISTENKDRVLGDDEINRGIETNVTAHSNHSKNGTRLADLDEDTQKLLIASGYNLTDTDLVLRWEVELVDLGENSTVADIAELSSLLGERIGDLARANRSGMLFVLDDSLSVLNAWFAEELKFVAVVLRNFFPLSEEHPMGLLTFSSKISRVALALNQTNECSVLSYMNNKILGNRGVYRDPNGSHDAFRGSTDLIRAAAAAANIARNSGLQRIAIMFVMDGAHRVMNADNEREQHSVVEKLNSLRNLGHEVYGLFVGEGLRTSGSFTEFQELFSDSTDGKRNLYTVQSFAELSQLVATINSTAPKFNNDSQCEEPHWIVPKDNDHILSSSAANKLKLF